MYNDSLWSFYSHFSFLALLWGRGEALLACQRVENKSVVNRSTVDRRGLLEGHLGMNGRFWLKRTEKRVLETDNRRTEALMQVDSSQQLDLIPSTLNRTFISYNVKWMYLRACGPTKSMSI